MQSWKLFIDDRQRRLTLIDQFDADTSGEMPDDQQCGLLDQVQAVLIELRKL
jgi:hypothetical protein